MESTLKNMVLSLLGVTFSASLGVGIVNLITEEPIRKAEAAATQAALSRVAPPFDSSSIESLVVDGLGVDVYTLRGDDGSVVGYAVKSLTKGGYSGSITLMVGVSAADCVCDVSVLSHSETPGLGSKMCDLGNSLLRSVQGCCLDSLDLRVVKDGGDLDALSGATITSRAYGDALSRAYSAVRIVRGRDGGGGVVGVAVTAAGGDGSSSVDAASQKLRMEQMMQQAKENQARDAAEARTKAEVESQHLREVTGEYYVDSAMMRQILRQMSYERYDWFLQKIDQEYRSDKEIKRRSAQLAAIAAERARQQLEQQD